MKVMGTGSLNLVTLATLSNIDASGSMVSLNVYLHNKPMEFKGGGRLLNLGSGVYDRHCFWE